MKKTLLFILLCLSVHTSTAQFRRAAYWHHSVGLCFWDRSQLSNLTPPTTLPKEIAAYNAARGYTGSAAVSMTESYFPGPEGVVNDNNWYRWDAVFTGTDAYGQTIDYSNPVIIVKTCYLSPQGMKSIDSIEAYKTHIRSIVSVMKNHPNNFFVLWTDYPAATDGHSDREGWSNTFSTWMKQTLATGNDSFGPFPPNIHVFDIFHKLASPVDGFCDSVYGSWDEGPGGDHPSNLAVALVDSAIVRETFDAAIAYESRSSPLAVTLPASTITTTGAQLNGSVNPNGYSTTCHFEFGTTTTYGTSTSVQNVGSGTSAVPVNAPLSGLTAGTLYHYRLVASSSTGTTYGGDSTFTTLTPPPTVVTSAARNITSTGAQLDGQVTPNGFTTSYHFEYGVTKSYSAVTSSQNAGAGATALPESTSVSGLTPGLLYHYRLVATNTGGTAYGGDTTFSTAIPPPTVTTAGASNITTTGAQLNGSVNPNGFSTSAYFEYGTTAAYGSTTSSQSAGSGSGAAPVNAPLSGMTPGTLYHYRISATNSGGMVHGFDSTFTTISYPVASIIAFLEGPDAGPSMSTALNSKGILAAHFQSIPIPSIAVDSITIEIRDSLQGAKSTLRRFAPAWLLSDGTIRDFLDTTRGYVGFTGVPAGNYYIVVRHRNHLAVMSSAALNLNAAIPPTAYDFSTGQAQAYGTNPMILAGTHYALISGNASNADDIINALDRVATRNNLGASGYTPADLNLDGVVNALDRVVARNNLGQASQVP